MKLIFSTTGSSGNCTVFEENGFLFGIDCGINPKEVNEGIKFRLSRLKHILITHAHKDHTEFCMRFLERGCHLYMGEETKCALDVPRRYQHYIHTIKDREQFKMADKIIVKPLFVPHVNSDLTPCENFSFLLYGIESKTKTYFATDCQYIPYTFKDLDFIFMECNYVESDGYFQSVPYINTVVEKRRFKSHMSLLACREFLKKQDMSKVTAIRLIHLSKSFYDMKDYIKETLEQEFHVSVYI